MGLRSLNSAGEILKQIFAYHSGVHGRSAGSNSDLVNLGKFRRPQLHAAQLGRGIPGNQAPSHSIDQCIGLLVDLLEHEMLEAALFYLLEIPVYFSSATGHWQVLERGNFEAVRCRSDHIAVVQVDDLIGMTEQGAYIRCNKSLVLADADNNGAAVAGGDNCVRVQW